MGRWAAMPLKDPFWTYIPASESPLLSLISSLPIASVRYLDFAIGWIETQRAFHVEPGTI